MDYCSAPECAKQSSKTCSRCLQARYCSKECQLKHWRVHKEHCSSPAEDHQPVSEEFSKQLQDEMKTIEQLNTILEAAEMIDYSMERLTRLCADCAYVKKTAFFCKVYDESFTTIQENLLYAIPWLKCEIAEYDKTKNMTLVEKGVYFKNLGYSLRK